MGLSSGTQPLPYGHHRDAAMDIDGLDVSPPFPMRPSADFRYSYLKITSIVPKERRIPMKVIQTKK